MSLIKHLWLAIAAVMILAFSGSMIASTVSSQKYLQNQLEMKNNDNAASLAISLSKLDDMTGIDLMISAQFDNGYYQYITLVSPEGNVLINKVNKEFKAKAPHWFTKLIPIKANPGTAFVQHGWTPIGTIQVMSDSTFAYNELWAGTLIMLSWNSIIFILSGIIGSLALRKVFKPVKAIVNQAEAIGDRRFITLQEPGILEFRILIAAMNRLSNRIKTMFADQATLLDALRKEANYEPISGLMNRKYFTSRVSAFIANEDSFSEGTLIVIHIKNLKEINQKIGEKETDTFLKKLGDTLNEYALGDKSQSTITGRLTGADLAVFIGKAADKYVVTSQIQNLLISAINDESLANTSTLHTLTSSISRNEQLDGLNQLISTAQSETGDIDQTLLSVIEHEHQLLEEHNDENEWLRILNESIEAKRLTLAFYPVIGAKGELMHYESPARMQLVENGPWLPASEFILWATRLNMLTRIDELVMRSAIDTLQEKQISIGLNVSTRAICDKEFLDKIYHTIKKHPKVASRLWLEVPESTVFNHLEEFHYFCDLIKPLGCKIGIEHIGSKISRLGEVFDFGVDYIKVDTSVIRGIDKNPGNMAFLKGLCLIGHSMGLTVIAEGVANADEKNCLPQLGIDGFTGPGIRET